MNYSLSLTFSLESNSFKDGSIIPIKYTCKGKGISPHVRWKNIPIGTKSYALLFEGLGKVHWLVYNIPCKVIEIHEGEYEKFEVGINDFGIKGYIPPCPPEDGKAYEFKLIVYALSIENLKKDLNKKELLKEVKGKVLGKAKLVGYVAFQEDF